VSKPLTICHIETAAGPRFSIHPTEEHLRQELISYYNEVHADADTEELPDDAPLEDVIEAIEEIESLSRETITINPQEFWA
jgi:hypothetical protein